jgi:hypothetical protein
MIDIRLGARSIGAAMVVMVFFAVWVVHHKDFDPTQVEMPSNAAQAIGPLLGFLTVAWWLLFR